MTSAGVKFRDFFLSLTGKRELPKLDISAEIAVIGRTSPATASALEALETTVDALTRKLAQLGDNTFPEISVLSRADGSLIAWMGQRDKWEGIYAKSIRLGATIAAPDLYTDASGNLVINGSVIVGMPPSSLDVDFPIIDNLTLQNNTPGAGRITWSAFTLSYRGLTYTVVTGSTASSAETVAYWDLSAPTVLSKTTYAAYSPANNRFVILINDAGTAYAAYQQPTKNSVLGIYIPDGAIIARHITAAAIDVTKLTLRKIIAVLTFHDNTPGAGSVSWDAGTIYYDGVAYAVSGGNTALAYVSWTVGSAALTAGASFTPAANVFLIATNVAGIYDNSWDKIGSQSLATAMFPDSVVTSAKILALDAGKITTGTLDAARIAAAAIDVTKLNIKRIIVSGLTLTSNSPSAGKIAWSACTVYYNGTAYAISSGNTSSTTHTQITWTVAAGTFASATIFTPGPTIFQIATNSGGTYDEVWDKPGNLSVQRSNLNFGLLEGYAPQAQATLTIDATGDTTVLSESAEGGLLFITFFSTGVVGANISVKITIDGTTERTISVMSTGVYTEEALAWAMRVVNDGTTSGDSITLWYGFTYKTSILIKVNSDNASPNVNVRIVYVHTT